MIQKRTSFISFVITLLTFATVFYFSDFGGAYNALLRNLVFLTTSFLPILFCLLAIKVNGYKNPHGKAMSFFVMAFTFWFAGEFLWSYYDFVLGVDPFPTLADIFYVLAYPFFFIGMAQEFIFGKLCDYKISRKLILPSIVSLVILIFGVSYFGIYLTYHSQENVLEIFLNTAYGVGDLVLLVMLLLMLILVWEFRHGKIFIPWVFFFAATLLMLAADVFFAIYGDLFDEAVMPYRQVADMLWMSSYTLFATSFFLFREIILNFQKDILKKLRTNT